MQDSNPNLASIEFVFDKIMDSTVNGRTFPFKSWYPQLEEWNNVLQLSCRELYSYMPFTTQNFKLIKKSLKGKLLELKKEILNSSVSIEIEDTKEMLLGIYKDTLEEIEYLNELTNEDLYIVLFITLEKFLERIELDDYSDFYELSIITEISKKTFLSNKQYGWIFQIMGKNTSDILELIKEFKIPGKPTEKKLNKGFYDDCLLVATMYKDLKDGKTVGEKKALPYIEDDLMIVLNYFETEKNEMGIEKTNKLLANLDLQKKRRTPM